MKYCRKCGNPMEDRALFCQRCGTKDEMAADEGKAWADTAHKYTAPHVWMPERGNTAAKQGAVPRTGMLVWAIICTICALMCAVAAVGTPNLQLIPVIIVCGILAGMFFVLVFSPRQMPYILGKGKGLAKYAFVLLSLGLALVCGVTVSLLLPGGGTQEGPERASVEAEDGSLTPLEDADVCRLVFDCSLEEAEAMLDVFDQVGIHVDSQEKVTRREDLDYGDGSVAYEVKDAARVNGEGQPAYLFFDTEGGILDIRFLSTYLFQSGVFVRSAQEVAQVAWAADHFSGECPVSVSTKLQENILGLKEVEISIYNNSDKTIYATKFLARPIDVYGESYDGVFNDEYTRLSSDEEIPAGTSKTLTWTLYGYSDAKSCQLWLYSVYYEDGSQWGIYDDGLSEDIMQIYGYPLLAQ